MNINPLASVVRILKQNDATAGTAFFFGNGHKLITCAHVIDYAGAKPGEIVRFKCLKEQTQTFTAKVLETGWKASDKEDIAILEIIPNGVSTPLSVKSASFGSSLNTLNKSFSTYGFPQIMSVDGLHGKGEVIGYINQNGTEILQLTAPEITYGFSGAPAWDTDTGLVIGVVVSILPDGQDKGRSTSKTAFITPIETIRRVFKESELEKEFTLNECPYRGLKRFEEKDKDIYFGRDESISELMTCLAKNNLVALVGVSGSGKSSLVRAGLARGLEFNQIPELVNKRRLIFQDYGQTPLLNLLKVLSRNTEEASQIEQAFGIPTGSLSNPNQDLRDILKEKTPAEIAQLLGRYFNDIGGVLLIVDQFERLFTDTDPEIRKRFMDILSNLSSEETKILISIRADYYGKLLESPGIGNAVKSAQVILSNMTREELKSVIEMPAKRLGSAIEPELSQTLVADVYGRPGDLPLLEFTLQELWKKDVETGVLTLKSYKELGYTDATGSVSGVHGTIIRRAEEVWKDLKRDGKEQIAERIFLSLVTPADPSDREELGIHDASRRAWLSEFDDESRKVAENLADSFLLTTSKDLYTKQPIIEISHEALIQHWTRLNRLSLTNHLFLKWYVQDFAPYFQGWLDEPSSYKKAKLLLPEIILNETEQWGKKYGNFFAGPRSEYIAQSAKRRMYKRIAQFGLAGAAALAVIVTLLAWHNANESTADELHERGVRALLEHNYQEAQLLLAKSLTYNDSTDTREHLMEARINGAKGLDTKFLDGNILASTPNGSHFVFKASDGLIKVWDRKSGVEKPTDINFRDFKYKEIRAALSLSGEMLALGNFAGEIYLWDVSANKRLQKAPPKLTRSDGSQLGVNSIAIAPDQSLIAYGDHDGKIHLWSPDATENNSAVLEGHKNAVHCLSFSSSKEGNNYKLASAGADYTVRLWNLHERKSLVLGFHDDFIDSIAFNSSADQIASGSADGSIRVWDLKDNVSKRELYMLTGHLGTVQTVNFNSDNSLILSGSEDKTVRLWDTSLRKEILKFGSYNENINKDAVEIVGFAEKDSHIVSGNRNGAVSLWEIAKREEGLTYYNSYPVTAVAFFPNNRRLAFGDTDGNLKVWDMDSMEISHLITTEGGINSLAIRKSDGLLAFGTGKGDVKLFDEKNNSLQLNLPKSSDNPVWALAFHPYLPLLAYSQGDRKIHIWNLQTNKEERKPLDHENVSIWALSYSSDGRFLVSGGGDKQIRIWDSASDFQKYIFEPEESDEIWGAPFDTNSGNVITAGLDRRIQIWSFHDLINREKSLDEHGNIKTRGDSLKKSDEHAGIIQSVAFSNGNVATASADNTVGLWNVTTEKFIQLKLHDRPVWWVNFSWDGNLLASGGIDKRVRISNMNSINHIFNSPVSKLLDEAKADTCLDFDKEKIISTSCSIN